MAEAKLGSLGARVIVDRGSRAHYGPDDLITGKVMLMYKPYTSLFKSGVPTADLFGPLKLEVALRGKIKIQVKRDREFSADYGMPLFRQGFNIFDGSFKAEVGQTYEFPFSVSFPTLANDLPLPPSMNFYFSDYPDKVDITIIYRMGCTVNMPGIDIKTTDSDYNSEPMVRFDFPRPPPSLFATPVTTFDCKSWVMNANLLPESERPSGFRAKTKAVFVSNNYPKFAYRLSCTKLQHIYPGVRPDFCITIRRLDLESTATIFPEVILVSVRADLIAETTVDTSGRLLASSTCTDHATIQKLNWKAASGEVVSLSKANDYSVTVQTNPVLAHTSSFSHPKVTRSYFMRMTVKLKIADQAVELGNKYAVVMVPPPSSSVQYGFDETVEAGPSGVDRVAEEDAELPAYHEIGAAPPKVTKGAE